MRVHTKETEIFTFDELLPVAQEKALSDEINFYLECIPYEDMSPNMQKAIDKAEEMQTPWFTGSYVFEYCKDEIVENIKANEREYEKDGSLYCFD